MKAHLLTAMTLAVAISGCSSVTQIAQNLRSRVQPESNSSPSEIAPYLYLSSYNYDSNDLTTCLANAERELRKLGFTDNTNKDTKTGYGSVGGDNPDGKVAAQIECDMSEGRTASTSLAVSSLDNARAYELYSKLNDSKW